MIGEKVIAGNRNIARQPRNVSCESLDIMEALAILMMWGLVQLAAP